MHPSDDVPSGLPDEAREEQPLGPEDPEPDTEAPDRGAETMPGIPTEGEPPSGG